MDDRGRNEGGREVVEGGEGRRGEGRGGREGGRKERGRKGRGRERGREGGLG